MGSHFLSTRLIVYIKSSNILSIQVIMMDKCCTGTFEIVRTQEECDFWAATHGKEFCDRLVGKKLCLKVTEICEGKMAFHVTSPDCPELSHFMVCCLGQEQCSNFPILGKCKVKICKTGDAKEFMLARGMPEKVACLIDDLKMHWKNCGTGFELRRKFGEHKMKTCAKFDEEFCETVPE